MSSEIPWPLPHPSLLTDAHFEGLRREPKIKASSTRAKDKMGHNERQYELTSITQPERRFRMFLRISLSNPEVFSIGLTLVQAESDLVLCRYNSGHHGHRNILEKEKIPPACHQHLATARYIAAGLEHKGFAVLRTEYDSFDGALALMIQECNIENVLPNDPQAKLFPIR